MKRFAPVILALLAALLLAQPAAADPPVWRVKGPKAEVTLFGSVHVLTADLAWRSPEIEQALAEADEIWFEVPITPASRQEGVMAAMMLGRMPGGRTLSDLLPRSAEPALQRAVQRLNLSMPQLQTFQPWFAEALISLADLQMRGAHQADGVEEQLSARAPATARRRAFETPAEQIAILARQSTKDQVASLVETLKQLEDKPESFKDLQKAWAAGDTGWIEREALGEMRRGTPRLYQTLVVARNRRWAARIGAMLKGETPKGEAPDDAHKILIIVGAGHLVGPESVPALLKRRGFTVEGP